MCVEQRLVYASAIGLAYAFEEVLDEDAVELLRNGSDISEASMRLSAPVAHALYPLTVSYTHLTLPTKA